MAESDELTSRQIEKLLARAKERPDLAALDWGELGVEDAEPGEAQAPHVEPRTMRELVESDPKTYDSRRTRIRDRYISVRFEGIARSAADLDDPMRVIKASRLAFEEGHPESALELLELAVDQHPFEKSLCLAEPD